MVANGNQKVDSCDYQPSVRLAVRRPARPRARSTRKAIVSQAVPTTAAPAAAEQGGAMTHREVLEALSGLLLAMFVAMLSSTVVSNALPAIVADLDGSQSGYTWVVVATLLTMTATTPIWGKLADLFNKKMLVQTALVIFSIGSLLAGFAPNMGVLIGARAVQGLGVGGLTALVQVVIATMVARASAAATPATSARSSRSPPSAAR